jgi:hypothetical protein
VQLSHVEAGVVDVSMLGCLVDNQFPFFNNVNVVIRVSFVHDSCDLIIKRYLLIIFSGADLATKSLELLTIYDSKPPRHVKVNPFRADLAMINISDLMMCSMHP